MSPCEPSVSRGMRHLAHMPKVQEVERERNGGGKEGERRRGWKREGRKGGGETESERV